jgi:hypothetical protein
MAFVVVLFTREKNPFDPELGKQNSQGYEDAGRENDSISVVYLE